MIRRRNAHEGDSPTVMWWVRDWLTSSTVLAMPRAARSLYFDLLMRQWLDGSLPLETKVLASLTGETHAGFLKLWQHVSGCFDKCDDGRLRNERMEKERKADEEYRAAKSVAGGKGAAKRWQSHGSVIDLPIPNGCPSSSSSLGIGSPTESAGVEPPPVAEDPPPKKPRAERTDDQAACAAHWRSEWSRTRSGTTCAPLEKRDYVLIAWMLGCADAANVRRRMTAILEDSEDFVHRKASLRLLKSQWDNYALAAVKPTKVPESPDDADLRSRWQIMWGRRIRDGKARGMPDWPGADKAKAELQGSAA